MAFGQLLKKGAKKLLEEGAKRAGSVASYMKKAPVAQKKLLALPPGEAVTSVKNFTTATKVKNFPPVAKTAGAASDAMRKTAKELGEVIKSLDGVSAGLAADSKGGNKALMALGAGSLALMPLAILKKKLLDEKDPKDKAKLREELNKRLDQKEKEAKK